MIKRLVYYPLLRLYRLLFARKALYYFNRMLFDLSLRGIGIFNFENDRASGEYAFLQSVASHKHNLMLLDVGANVGNYANRVKQLCPDATVYAFEPHPGTFQQLQAAAQRYGYTALNMGCSDVVGQVALYNYKNAPGSQHASLFKDVIEHIHHGESTVVQVDVTTIDRFMEEHAIQKIDVLKIDTEGNDLNVLHGAKHAIEQQRVDIIHFEFNEMNVVSRVFFKDFCDILPNYTFYRMLPDGIISLGEYYPLVFEIFAFQNIVAIRKGVSIT